MRIAVLGAGVSGIVISKMLCKHYDVQVFEKSDTIAGIAKVRMIKGLNYHICGGHGFNSKHKNVLDWVFSEEPLDYHVTDHAYIVNTHKTKKAKESLLNYFNTEGVYMLGRFAEWSYYNMDMCIYSALQLANKLTTHR